MGEVKDNEYEEELVDFEDDDPKALDSASAKPVSDSAKRGYVGIHSSGFRDFLLKPELLRAIVDSGFEHPSEVQHECIPQAILGMDVICQAKSGMGKTAVFVLSSLQQIEPVAGQVAALVLCHTRELAYQICHEFERFSTYLPDIRVAVFYGGVNIRIHKDMLKNECPHIVVGTPGRILALARDKDLGLKNVRHFILDECDKMLESLDMRRDVQEIFKMTPHDKQVMMFSATLSKEIRPVCKKFMQEPMEIYVDDETKLTLHGLVQHYILLKEAEKNRKLNDLLDALDFNQVVIFVKFYYYYYFTHRVQSCLQHTNKPQRNTTIIIKKKMSEQKEEMEEVEVIHSWSAPRSLSTCLMYSFAQRDDMEVLDEPLYAFFLRTTGIDRPYKEELLSKMESDGNKIVKEVIFGPGRKKYRFCKHIAKERLYGLPNDLMKKGKHFILIRNPIDILPSFDKVVSPTFLELGLADLVSIYNELRELGRAPTVIDAADLKRDPEATLRGLCDDLEIPFQDAMLKWEAGPKPVDGIWAPWWYKSVHKSTGFQQSKKYPVPFPFSLYELLEQSLPLYNSLRRHVKQTSSLIKSSLPPPDLPVPANEKLLAWVGDEILPRESAKVSVFDSVVQGGDSVWEGLRVYSGKIFKLDEHLDRLFDSAKALAFINVPTREEVKEAIFNTLIRNGMFDNAHIRLSLTRGKKVTSGMSPAFNLYGCTLIVLPEWKPPVYDNVHGITLVTATTRRNSPNNLDSKIHHNNLLNNILAKIEGNNANADDAIMLDKDGYVSETNATNIFLVKKGHILTPHADYCLPGITRATVMDLVVKEQLVLVERRISLSEFHTADEVWTTGTMGELTPVVKIDGRIIGTGQVGPVTLRVQNAYKKLTEESGVPIPTYHRT